MLDWVLRFSFGIDEVKTSSIGGITVSDESDFLIGLSCSSGFGHSHGSWQDVSGVGDVVGGNFTITSRDEKECISMLASDFDVGFIAATMIVDFTFESQVEVMAIGCCSLNVVEHSLIGNRASKDLF